MIDLRAIAKQHAISRIGINYTGPSGKHRYLCEIWSEVRFTSSTGATQDAAIKRAVKHLQALRAGKVQK